MRYFKAKKVVTEHTTLSFNSTNQEDKIVHYDEIDGVEFLGVESADVEGLLAKQPAEIEAVEITFAEAKPTLDNCRLMKDYNEIIDKKVAEKYSIPKEIGLLKLIKTDPVRVVYQQYVDSCKAEVRPMKLEKGLVE
ncbi:MAG: hypothetical protein M0P61_00500 [Ignavibacteriaceae bacterium]|jgi:hypothetical protein|nr:hypothetical protein [Ignavibacteriaceae bacterium]